MKGFKKLATMLLSVLTLCIGAGGFAACNGVNVDPNGSGGVVITPNSGNPNTNSGQDSLVSILPSSEQESDASETPSHTHTWGEGVITVPATCTEVGEISYTCSTCDEVRTESVATVDHVYYNKECTVCGLPESDHVHM
ncbi:MAG: hypothetical protein E7371_04790 [Clostridiales bacterium]|nr:hypothetical protein [Clostridiales bacterium]